MRAPKTLSPAPQTLCSGREFRVRNPLRLALLCFACVPFSHVGAAQDYVARFTLEQATFLSGAPIFCNFTLENTGAQTLSFSYRFPSRVLNRELGLEPRFRVTDEAGHSLPDPAPKPCGGAKGSVVYGSATLSPGQTHTERWLLNQWARCSRPGRYHLRAERRLPLFTLDLVTQKLSDRPAAYAMAINELTFKVVPSTEDQLKRAFQPYLSALEGAAPSAVEAALVLTTLPQNFFASKLEAMANAPQPERGWDRKEALEGLARLDTRVAWDAILRVARGSSAEPVRSYAILLLAEKGDIAFLPELLGMIRTPSPAIRGDLLRALGFFHDPRANRILFEDLHSTSATDRMNAILGLKNLESREAIPALLAMLSDPDAQVRHVANFALQSLTGQRFELPPTASRLETARTAQRWHTWWRDQGASAALVRQPTCHDW